MPRRSSHTKRSTPRVPAGPAEPARLRRSVFAKAGHDRSRVWLSAGALVLLGALAYSNSLAGAFVIDDHLGIVHNPDIRRVWSVSSLRSAWGESAVLGRPLVTMTFAINYAIDGLNVRGYHAGNIAFHLLCALALFGLIRRVRHSITFAFVCASLWMLHPLNTEVVDYLSQRTESMMGLFYLLTVYAGVRAHAATRPAPWLVAAVVSSALGTLCKQSMITVPVAVVLVDVALFFDSPRAAFRSRWRFYTAVAAASWLVVSLTVLVSPPGRSVGFASGPSPWVYLLNQSVMITRYLALAVWPRDLVANYGYQRPYTLTDVLPQMLFISSLFALALVGLRYRPKLGLLGAWFFLTLALTSSVAPIANEVGAERRMYLPLMAVVVLAVGSLAQVADYLTRAGRVSARAAAVTSVGLWVAAAAALGAGTLARNRDYASPLQLARTDFERWPVAYTRHALAGELLVVGQGDEAIAHLRVAIRDDPRAYFTLGRALFEAGHLREAREQLEEFVRLRPLLIEAVDARSMIGRTLVAEGQLDAATEQFRQVLRMQPSFYDAHLGLGDVLLRQQRFDEAIVEYRAYFARGGRNEGVWINLGVAFARTGRIEDAIQAFQRAIEVNPRSGEAYRNLAAMLVERGDTAAAVQAAGRAVALDPGDAPSRDLLGLALAAARRPDEAIQQFREAVRLNPSDAGAQEHLRQALEARGVSPRVSPRP